MSSHTPNNVRPAPDSLLVQIADYVTGFEVTSDEAWKTARYCLLDSLGCAVLGQEYEPCRRLLGPTVPGTVVPHGTRVPGTSHVLDPIQAAFSIGCSIRWLDFNDTWLAAEWGHPSDNLGAILGLADHLSRFRQADGKKPLVVRDLLHAAIKAHEIQGILALENGFNRVGLDHVLLVRIASTAVATWMWGGTRDQVIDALSNAWIDGGALRTYRHSPNTGSRKSWAAGDATSRAVRIAQMVLRGEMGYPSALSAPRWGFQDVLFRGKPVTLAQPLGSYVMENVLFKISFPAEFHAQTAVEAAFQLHPKVGKRLDDVEKIVIHTQESAVRIIDKSGPLYNPADRDHCIQYMAAIGLIFGALDSDHYENEVAADPRIDRLRATMSVVEDPRYSRDYLDPSKRSIANAIQVFFKDGTSTEKVEVEYPVGHRIRRAEGIPLLLEKFAENLKAHYKPRQAEQIHRACLDERLEEMPVPQFMELWIPNE